MMTAETDEKGREAIITYLAAAWSVVAALGLAGLTLAAAVTARAVVTAVAHLRAVRRHALRHAQTARLVGHPEPALGAVLVDHDRTAAYCVAGPLTTAGCWPPPGSGARYCPSFR